MRVVLEGRIDFWYKQFSDILNYQETEMSTPQREREKKLAKLQLLTGLVEKYGLHQGTDKTTWNYTQVAGGGTKVVKQKLKKSSRSRKKKVTHVKVYQNDCGKKDYQIYFTDN